MPVYEKKDGISCGNCVHFHRHYIWDRTHYIPLSFGHCVFPRLKDRRDTDACPHWRFHKKELPPTQSGVCPWCRHPDAVN